MSVFPRGRRTSLRLDSFVDLTEVPCTSITKTITFATELPADEAAAVWLRIESTDDVDQAKRAGLRADRDALGPEDPLRRLYNYLLGEA